MLRHFINAILLCSDLVIPELNFMSAYETLKHT